MSGYNALDSMLILSLIDKFHRGDKKKVKKLTLKAMQRHLPGAGYLFRECLAGKFSEVIRKHVDQFLTLNLPATELANLGCCGMVVYQDCVYPVQIEFEGREDRDWMKANEEEVSLAVLHAAMNQFNMKRIEGTVVLFQNCGFSGIRHTHEIEVGLARKFDRQVGSSQYFA